MAAALGGVDAVVFTGGVGERSAAVRAECCRASGWLGVALDDAANERAAGDADVTAPGAATRVLVIDAREDPDIARQVRQALVPR